MNLNIRQKGILKDLLGDDDWVSLLAQIEQESEIKPWKPGGASTQEEKEAKWIYESGARRGKSDILEIFRLTK